MKREAKCVDNFDKLLDDKFCVGEQKMTLKDCYQAACPKWHLGEWSQVRISIVLHFYVSSSMKIYSM